MWSSIMDYPKLYAKELFDQGYSDTESGNFECFEDEQAINIIQNLKGYLEVKGEEEG